MLISGKFKNEEEIETTVQGILKWNSVNALSPSQTLSPAHKGAKIFNTPSTFSNSVVKLKVVDRSEEGEKQSDPSSSL